MEFETIGNVRVGKPDVGHDSPSHSPGVREGNKTGSMKREPGIERRGRFMVIANARRSTGINPRAHGPIDPRMPHLTPP